MIKAANAIDIVHNFISWIIDWAFNFIYEKGRYNMWKVIIRLMMPLTAIYTYLATKFYMVRKSYYKLIDKYNSDLIKNLSDEEVHHYISNINKLPKNSYNQVQRDKIRSIYIMVKKNNNISEDLKTQLRVALKLKGIDKL